MNINKISLIATLLIISLMLVSAGCEISIGAPSASGGKTVSNVSSGDNIFTLFKRTPCDNDSDAAALAYLGYDIDYEDLNAKIAEKLSGVTTEEFSHIRRVELDGDEYYLIVPKYADSTVNVYKSDMETGYDKSSPILSTTSEAIVLKCNVSDIITNSVVEISYTDNDGKAQTLIFSPSISLKDGELTDTEKVFEYGIAADSDI